MREIINFVANAADVPLSHVQPRRRGEDRQMHLFANDAINSSCCMAYHLKLSRIQQLSWLGYFVDKKIEWLP